MWENLKRWNRAVADKLISFFSTGRFKIILVVLVLGVAQAVVIYKVGFFMGARNPQVVQVQGVTNIDNPNGVTADFGTFWQAWGLINNDYLRNENVTTDDKVNGAIRGLVNSLGDPYTDFFTPQEGQKFQEDVQGSFGGVGIQLGKVDGTLAAIAPMKGTPAETAGILAGDLILSVDGSSTASWSIDEAVSHIRGPIGSKVKLSIFRKNWEEPKDFMLTRQEIVVPTLDYSVKAGNIAHIQLYNFNANVPAEFYRALNRANQENVKGIVLDLRGNPGGYLDVAVELAGWFIPKGRLVVSEEGKGGKVLEQLKADGSAAMRDVPLVVLIDKGSASAAEILAGALRDDNGVKLVGEKSFGKGTVQEVKELRGGASIKMTIAHWVLPSGKVIDHEGLEPDVVVERTEDDIKNKRDPQLEKALELLTTKK
jgi:carboxyl-terminal processing protease